MRLLRQRMFLLALAAAAGPMGGTAAATDWSSFGGVAGAGSRATGEMLGTRFAPLWTAAVPSSPNHPEPVYRALLASPAVADGYIAAASYGNKVRVLRERDGEALWDAEVGDAVIASPVIDRGWLYVPCLDRKLYAFRLGDGKLLWKTDLGGIIYSSPLVAGGALLVAVGTPQSRLVRVNSETGAVVWTAGANVLTQSVDSAVVVAGERVLVSEVNARLHSFSIADGQHQWTRQAAGVAGLTSPGLGAPVVVGARAYLPLGGPAASILAVDLATGEVVPGWPVDFTSSLATASGTPHGRVVVLSSLAAADGLVVVNARVDDSVDTDANGLVDLFRSREVVVAIDAAVGALAWTFANGSRDTADPNLIPTHGLVPTPAIDRGLATAGNEGLLVIGSSLAAQVTVLTLSTGARRGSFALPSPTRASAVVANGRLVVATDSGAVVALASRDNRPPPAPAGLRPAGGASSDAGGTVVSWRSVLDVDGDAVIYQLRWDSDGEILHTADEATTSAGVTSWRLPPLAAGATITYSVRARDARGAWSAWSAPANFSAVSTPPVQVGTISFPSLLAAIAAARPGDTVRLAPGRYPLAETMTVPAGVTIQGAGPAVTILDGHGLARAVTLSSSSDAQPATLRDVTITGAATGVATDPGTHAELRNVIIRDNTAFGIDVGASAKVSVNAATMVRNDVAARSFGALTIRNSIIAQNRRGLTATPAQALLSRYNDLFANKEVAYENVLNGIGDLAVAVTFQTIGAGGEFRLPDGSPTTDHGDPADDVASEPAPNGGRINLGAFAGTAEAELTQPSSSVGAPNAGATPVASPPNGPSVGASAAVSPRSVGPSSTASGGCAVAPAAGRSPVAGGPWAALCLLALIAGRGARRGTRR